MKAWFGVETGGIWKAAGTTPEELGAFAGKADSAGQSKSADFVNAAISAGLATSRDEYVGLMHQTAMALARSRIKVMLSTGDADIVQSIRALDTVNESFNEISERLTEWYGIHFPEYRARPNEVIDGLLKESADATGEPVSGAPLTSGDLAALKGFAAAARHLFEERRALESYISVCMEDVAPNLSDVLGPLLGARLIAYAGGLDRLARLPSGSIQVMGAGEALFRHLREGTPSPKHGFIYRHPLISGSPKKARGRMSRMIAGRAAIAARVDAFSGERLSLGQETREKAARIRRGKPGKGAEK